MGFLVQKVLHQHTKLVVDAVCHNVLCICFGAVCLESCCLIRAVYYSVSTDIWVSTQFINKVFHEFGVCPLCVLYSLQSSLEVLCGTLPCMKRAILF